VRHQRLTVAQWFAIANGLLLLVGLAGVIGGFLALDKLGDERVRIVDRLQPAIATALRLDTALADQEAGVRGFALTQDARFLDAYRRGRAAEPRYRADMRELTRGLELDDEVRAAARSAAAGRTATRS
jgi:CHASE3 domain sensor protein